MRVRPPSGRGSRVVIELCDLRVAPHGTAFRSSGSPIAPTARYRTAPTTPHRVPCVPCANVKHSRFSIKKRYIVGAEGQMEITSHPRGTACHVMMVQVPLIDTTQDY